MSATLRLKRTTLSTLGLIALLLLLLAAVRSAQAHAGFVGSDPLPNSILKEPIREVTIWFSEPLEPEFSEVQVLNTQGEQVDNGDSHVLTNDPKAMTVSLPGLPDGVYTVAWRNLSTVDGHTLRGSFLITFGESTAGSGAAPISATANASPMEALARALVLVGAMALVGGLAFERLLLHPIFFQARRDADVVEVGRRLMRRARLLIWVAFAVLAVGSIFQLIIQAAAVSGIELAAVRWRDVDVVLAITEWARLWLIRFWLVIVAFCATLMVTLIGSSDDESDDSDMLTRATRIAALLASVGILCTISFTSHGAALGELRAAAIFSDILHLIAAGFWLGGLFHFAISARPLFHALSPPQRRDVLADLVPRFSTLAVLSVGILVITGLYSSWAHVTTLAALETPYGRALLVKLALFLPMLVLGAVNLIWISPRLRDQEAATSRLRRTVSTEAFLALLIVLVVGLLTSLEPARQVAVREGLISGQKLSHQDTLEGAAITLNVEPALVGNNRFSVELRDRQDQPITNASELSLELTYLDTELGEQVITLQPAEPGHYISENVFLSVAGHWQVNLLLRRPDAFDAHTAFRFDVKTAARGPAPTPRAGYILWGVELALLGLLFLAVSSPYGSRWHERPGRPVVVLGAFGLVAGLLIAVGSPLFVKTPRQASYNPFPATAESVSLGEVIYVDNCLACHGEAGRGEGPASPGLGKEPADLVTHVPMHPDRNLFNIISNGVPESSMPGFGDQLSEDEIWHLVNYLRTLEDMAEAGSSE